MQRRTLLAAPPALGLAAPATIRAQGTGRTTIEFWYGLSGALGERVAEQVKRFNDSQQRFTVNASFKGSYIDTMTGAIAAWRAGNPPQSPRSSRSARHHDGGRPGDPPSPSVAGRIGRGARPEALPGGVRGYYSDTQGRLISMPHNSSSRVHVAEPGRLPEGRPLDRGAAADLAAGPRCGGADQGGERHPGGHHHHLADLDHAGADGLHPRHPLRHPRERVRGDECRAPARRLLLPEAHRFPAAAAEGRAVPLRRRDNAADPLFPAGKAAISFNSSGLRARVEREAKFKWVSVPLPYHDDVIQQPKNGVIGGASLWVLSARNRPAEEYRGVAEFFRFISDVDQDLWWHKVTGYVPLTTAAYEKGRAEGYYTQNPGADAAIRQLRAPSRRRTARASASAASSRSAT
jgi:sn-glycerol 3-phosphate transport system substrate-binding protein